MEVIQKGLWISETFAKEETENLRKYHKIFKKFFSTHFLQIRFSLLTSLFFDVYKIVLSFAQNFFSIAMVYSFETHKNNLPRSCAKERSDVFQTNRYPFISRSSYIVWRYFVNLSNTIFFRHIMENLCVQNTPDIKIYFLLTTGILDIYGHEIRLNSRGILSTIFDKPLKITCKEKKGKNTGESYG